MNTISRYFASVRGLPALGAIVVLGLLGTFLGGTMLRRLAWTLVAVIAVLAALHEWSRSR